MAGWRGPQYPGEFPSLGWLLLDWFAEYLPSPRDDKSPFVLTDEQAKILIRWYAIDPKTGRFVHRRGASERSKGWGKSPFEGGKALAEFAGPVVFDGWDANGEPVGRPWGMLDSPAPWVQIAAVSEDQTENTYSALYAMLTANDSRAARELRIDEGRTRLYLLDRPGRLEPVTASAGTREGQPITYAVLDETHLWFPTNGGVKLARTIRRNVAKMGGRTYETTNAPVPGENSVAEDTQKAAVAGAKGVFYDCVRAPKVEPSDSDAKLRKALAVAYGDSVKRGGRGWVDLVRLVEDIRDPDTPWEDALRFFFNQSVKSPNQWCGYTSWMALADPKSRLKAGDHVALGFDGSRYNDATALVAVRMSDGYAQLLNCWEKKPTDGPDWEVPEKGVRRAVAAAMKRYRVVRLSADPPYWQNIIGDWYGEYGKVVREFHTNKPSVIGPAVELAEAMIRAGGLRHDGDEQFARHVANADRDTDRGYAAIRKRRKGSPEKIDAAMAWVIANKTREKLLAAGWEPEDEPTEYADLYY